MEPQMPPLVKFRNILPDSNCPSAVNPVCDLFCGLDSCHECKGHHPRVGDIGPHARSMLLRFDEGHGKPFGEVIENAIGQLGAVVKEGLLELLADYRCCQCCLGAVDAFGLSR